MRLNETIYCLRTPLPAKLSEHLKSSILHPHIPPTRRLDLWFPFIETTFTLKNRPVKDTRQPFNDLSHTSDRSITVSVPRSLPNTITLPLPDQII